MKKINETNDIRVNRQGNIWYVRSKWLKSIYGHDVMTQDKLAEAVYLVQMLNEICKELEKKFPNIQKGRK